MEFLGKQYVPLDFGGYCKVAFEEAEQVFS